MTSILAKIAALDGDKVEIVIPIDGDVKEELPFLVELEDLLRTHGKEYTARGV